MTPHPTTELPPRRTRRAVRLVAGWTLLGAGAALLVLPGPGIPLVLGGLALLAPEQAWAARLHRRIVEGWARARERRGSRGVESPPPANGER
jgi:Putative transmembrane protein (PGPGW)